MRRHPPVLILDFGRYKNVVWHVEATKDNRLRVVLYSGRVVFLSEDDLLDLRCVQVRASA